jgi:hypothetical protein
MLPRGSIREHEEARRRCHPRIPTTPYARTTPSPNHSNRPDRRDRHVGRICVDGDGVRTARMDELLGRIRLRSLCPYRSASVDHRGAEGAQTADRKRPSSAEVRFPRPKCRVGRTTRIAIDAAMAMRK